VINEYPSHQEVSKEQLVQTIFDSIANQYDIINNLMSFGLHHAWRKFLINQTELKQGQLVLDVCCGTGSVTFDLAAKVGNNGQVIAVDLSSKMLSIAESKLAQKKLSNIQFIKANALYLPFPENTFDCLTIAYGLRNVANIQLALSELHRVIKPGGKIVSLEMTTPIIPVIKEVYNYYLKSWVPWIGSKIARNRWAYQYLNESIRNFPSSETILHFFDQTGFINTKCFKLCFGIVAVHSGIKP
jgi:demethylmenaquinone methyltransferase/2-methoxy-6-polyprenyl-1,4-benzoquinol methylase